MTIVTMNQKELARLRVMQDLEAGRTTPKHAADILNLTARQVHRLRTRYVQDGAAGLASLRRGRPSNRALPEQIKTQIIEIVRTYYADFGPTFARQKLHDRHGILLGVTTLRRWMKADGLWVNRRERRRLIYQPRYRRECLGELIQIDGSEHWWFEGRGPQCTLLVYIDDATSKLMHLKFVESESAFAYFAATSEYLHEHGKPVAFYSDKHSIFRVTNKSAVGGDGMTQFGRALYELNIDIICANTPQAKGRVERANRTLQDRLVKELRLAGISSMMEANEILPDFIADYNQRFGKPPRNEKNLHRPLTEEDKLDAIFVWREERTVSASLTLQYDKVIFILEPTDLAKGLVRKRVTVSDYPNGRVMISHKGVPLPYSIFDKVRQVDQAAIVDNKRLSAVLMHIQQQQALRPLYRSEKGPRRSMQENSLFNAGGRIADKRKSRPRRRRLDESVATVLATLPPEQACIRTAPRLSYEEELCLEIGRRVREEQAEADARRRLARQKSRKSYLRRLRPDNDDTAHVKDAA